MTSFKFYRGLVFEPDVNLRNRFRAVASGSPRFDRIEPTSDLHQTLHSLNSEQVDVIFVGNLPDVQGFIKLAKKTKFGALSAYVVLKRTRPESEVAAAAEVVGGADTVLYEPYSVDSVTETTKIADAIREADAQKKREAALRLIFTKVVEEVDNIGDHSVPREEGESKSMLTRLKHLGEQLQQATKSAAIDFHSSLSKTFEEAAPPISRARRKAYGGVSERVQRLLDRRQREKATKESSTDESN